ncbi:OmpA family protein [Maribacter sp. 2307ULW6-5]|uniref:OmpA family protein n=1 Tax=Maribacter sp. 2307ULW6-5 TaxID=3386275 RepID=UPI0039BD28AE
MNTARTPLITFLFTLFLLGATGTANAQFLKKLGKAAERAAKRTVENRVERETSKKTDAALDSILEPGSKKKGKAPQEPQPEALPRDNNPNGSAPVPGDQSAPPPTSNENNNNLKVYSKFDFVAGDKLLFFDDFENDFLGDFPSKWNTDGGGEVVQVTGSDQKWLQLKMASYYIPDVPDLPEEYTIEFDVLPLGLDKQTSSSAKLHVILDDSDAFGYGKNSVYAYLPFVQYIASGIRIWGQANGKRILDNTITADVREEMRNAPHISIAVNKERFRLWINETKYLDVPRIVTPNIINTLKFEAKGFKDGEEQLLLSNIKVKAGGVDLRRKLMSEGKVSTNGILFNSGSAKLQPASMGIIRQVSQVLLEDASLNLKIVGHTDSDGPEEANLALSQERAAAVKSALTSVYGIDASRLTTGGKGEREPVAPNDSPNGKAQNRRVEFIKQ